MRRMRGIRSVIGAVVFISLVSLACGTQSNTDATAQALGEAFNLTATALGGETSAGTGGGAVGVETIQANATGTAQSRAATRAAEDALDAEAIAGTATAVAPILAELPLYGVDPSEGHLGWVHN